MEEELERHVRCRAPTASVPPASASTDRFTALDPLDTVTEAMGRCTATVVRRVEIVAATTANVRMGSDSLVATVDVVDTRSRKSGYGEEVTKSRKSAYGGGCGGYKK